MSSENHIKDLIERLYTIESEMKLLQEDRKDLFAEFSDKVDIKAFKVAWSFVKRTEKLNEESVSEIVDLIKKLEDN